MAMTVISSVPVTSGTMPKAPDEPTWSARIAVCGLHCRPNRKSSGETFSKKRTVSNSTENTMPMVVRTATQAQASSTILTTRSTWLRARKFGRQRCAGRRRAPSRPKIQPAPTIERVRQDAQRGVDVGGALQRRRRRRRNSGRRDRDDVAQRGAAPADRRSAMAGSKRVERLRIRRCGRRPARRSRRSASIGTRTPIATKAP